MFVFETKISNVEIKPYKVMRVKNDITSFWTENKKIQFYIYFSVVVFETKISNVEIKPYKVMRVKNNITSFWTENKKMKIYIISRRK